MKDPQRQYNSDTTNGDDSFQIDIGNGDGEVKIIRNQQWTLFVLHLLLTFVLSSTDRWSSKEPEMFYFKKTLVKRSFIDVVYTSCFRQRTLNIVRSTVE